MDGKKIATVAVCVLAFGGIIANTATSVTADHRLQNEINVVTDDYKAADQELIRMIQDVRTELTAAYKAADDELKNAIVTLRSDLTKAIDDLGTEVYATISQVVTLLEDEIATKGEEIYKYLADNYYTYEEVEQYVSFYDNILYNIIQDLAKALNTLAQKEATDVQNLTALINNLDVALKALEQKEAGDVENLNEAIADLAEKEGADIEEVKGLISKLEALEAKDVTEIKALIQALTEKEAGDVATLTQLINTLEAKEIADVTEIKSLIQALTEKEATDYQNLNELLAALEAKEKEDIAAVNKLIEGLDARLKVVEDTYATKVYVDAEIVKVMKEVNQNKADIKAINESIDAFRGEIAQKAKADGVAAIEKAYDDLLVTLDGEKTKALEAGIEEKVVDGFCERILYKHSTSIKYNIKEEGKAYVLLAKDAKTAKEVADEYIARMNCELYEFRLFVAKFVAKKTISENPVLSSTAIPKFNALVDKIEYKPTSEKATERTTYFNDLITRVDLVKHSAVNAFAGVTTFKNDSIVVIDSFKYISKDIKDKYTKIVDDKADVDAFIKGAEIEDIVTTKATTATVDAHAKTIRDFITLTVEGKLYNYDLISKKGGETVTYISGLGLDKEANDYFDAEAKKVMDFATYEKAVENAKTIAECETCKNEAVAKLDGFVLASGTYKDLYTLREETKTAIKKAFVDAKITDLDLDNGSWRKQIDATFNLKDFLVETKDFGTDTEKYTVYVTNKMKAIQDYYSLTEIAIANRMAVETCTYFIDAYVLEPYSIKNSLAYRAFCNKSYAYFDACVYDSYPDFSFKDVTVEKATENRDALIADINAFVKSAEKYVKAIQLIETTNGQIDDYKTTFKDNFLAKYNNGENDGQKVLDEKGYGKMVDDLGDSYKYVLVTLPDPKVIDAMSYEDAMAKFAELDTSLDSALSTEIAATYTNYVKYLDETVLPQMIECYNGYEKDTLDEKKESYSTLLYAAYLKYCEDYPQHEEALTEAYENALTYIEAAKKSDDVQPLYEAALKIFDNIVSK